MRELKGLSRSSHHDELNRLGRRSDQDGMIPDHVPEQSSWLSINEYRDRDRLERHDPGGQSRIREIGKDTPGSWQVGPAPALDGDLFHPATSFPSTSQARTHCLRVRIASSKRDGAERWLFSSVLMVGGWEGVILNSVQAKGAWI